MAELCPRIAGDLLHRCPRPKVAPDPEPISLRDHVVRSVSIKLISKCSLARPEVRRTTTASISLADHGPELDACFLLVLLRIGAARCWARRCCARRCNSRLVALVVAEGPSSLRTKSFVAIVADLVAPQRILRASPAHCRDDLRWVESRGAVGERGAQWPAFLGAHTLSAARAMDGCLQPRRRRTGHRSICRSLL